MKINIKILLKSLQYIMIPTLSVFVLLFLYFLSWEKFVGFIASGTVLASLIRVGLGVIEVIFVYFIYQEELKNYYRSTEYKNSLLETKPILSGCDGAYVSNHIGVCPSHNRGNKYDIYDDGDGVIIFQKVYE